MNVEVGPVIEETKDKCRLRRGSSPAIRGDERRIEAREQGQVERDAVALWMCDAVVPASRPLNVTCTCRVWVTLS